MRNKARQIILKASVSTLLLALIQPQQGHTQIWSGATSQLTLGGVGGNWNNQPVPGITDTAEFQSVGSLAPTVNNILTPTDFHPLNVQFDNFAPSYGVIINANNSGTGNATFEVGDGTSGAVTNFSTHLQTFEILSGGKMEFLKGSSASPVTNTVPVNYQVSSNGSSVSSLVFTDALAGNSNISVNSPTFSQPTTLLFNGASDAQVSTINTQRTGTVTFSGTSNVNAATITATAFGSVVFNTSTTLSTAELSLETGSTSTLNQSITLDRLTDDGTETTSVNLNANTLTIANPTSGDTILSLISGAGGSFVKQGVNDLTLGNTTNSYTGGTTVTNGILFVSPQSLPSFTATVQSNGILNFNSGPGTNGTNIAVDGNIEISTNTPITLSGTISGSGKITVDTSSDLTLTGTGSSYSGGTYVAGTLHTKVANLPPSASIITTDSAASIHFTSSSPENYTGSTSGPGKFFMDGTSSLQLSGPNTYTGGTTINSGTLIVSTSTLPLAAVEPTAVVNGSGILDFNQSFPGTFIGNVSLMNSTSQVQTDGAGPLTLAGVISGIGKLNVNSGYAILANTGNTYSGGTLVSGGTLQTTVSTLPVVNKNILVLNGTLNFQELSNETYAAQILSGTGVLQKTGAATLTLTGNNSGFSGTTKILQGTLALNSILGGNTLIDTGGTLTGNGKILGNLHVHNGTVSPGGGINTLTVGGNYQQDIAGIYRAEINGSGQSDLITIGGTATLAGMLTVVSVDGVLDLGKTYTIMHADGGVFGHFTFVNSNIPEIVPLVTYRPNDVLINLQHIITVISSNTHNEKVVAEQLLSITNPTAQEKAIINELTALSSNPNTINLARRALDQMSGEQYSNTMLTTELAARQFLRRLYDPLRPLLLNKPCCQSEDCCTYQDGSYEFPFQCTPRDPDYIGTSWVEIGGGRSFLRHDTNAHGFQMDSFGFGVGHQMTISPDVTFGFAAGYQHDGVTYNIGGRGKNNIGLLGVYTLYNPEDFYLLGDLVLGYNSCRVSRPIDIGDLHYKAHGKPHAVEGMLYIEGGKVIDMCWFQLQPFVGLEADCYYSHRFRENGACALDMTVDSKTYGAAFSRLGFHFSSYDVCHYLSFDIDLAWQCRLSSMRNHLRQSFTNFGTSFDIYGVNSSRNCFDGTATAEVILGHGCAAFLEVSGQRWERLSSYNLVGGISVEW